jgi:hypothetical protein
MNPCKKEGCNAPVKGRQMCVAHYMAWYHSLPSKPQFDTVEQLVLAEMPGTYTDVCVRAGVSIGWGSKIIRRLHAQRRIHVCELIPPTVRGQNYTKVFAAKPGRDVKLTEAEMREHVNAKRRHTHAIKQSIAKGDHLVNSFFGMSRPGASARSMQCGI